MASSPITSWQIEAENVEEVTDFIFLEYKSLGTVTAAMKSKLLGRKAITKLDHILRSRDTTLLTMVCIIKATVFPVVVHGCESWTIKKAEQRKIIVFKCSSGEEA